MSEEIVLQWLDRHWLLNGADAPAAVLVCLVSPGGAFGITVSTADARHGAWIEHS